jgi:arylformamidase
MAFVELSHEIRDGMPAFPGLDPPQITAILDHEESRPRYGGQAEFYLGKIEMACNTGTYIDSPFHRFRDGRDLSEIGLDDVAGLPGVVLDGHVGNDRAVALDAGDAVLAGKAVLIRTGWDERWGSEGYWEPGPFVSPEALEMLLRSRPKLVGVDFWNIDDIEDPSRRVHTALLRERILIVEHLCNLASLPPQGFRFFAVPLRLVGGASIPVRAFAEIPDRPSPEGGGPA